MKLLDIASDIAINKYRSELGTDYPIFQSEYWYIFFWMGNCHSDKIHYMWKATDKDNSNAITFHKRSKDGNWKIHMGKGEEIDHIQFMTMHNEKLRSLQRCFQSFIKSNE